METVSLRTSITFNCTLTDITEETDDIFDVLDHITKEELKQIVESNLIETIRSQLGSTDAEVTVNLLNYEVNEL